MKEQSKLLAAQSYIRVAIVVLGALCQTALAQVLYTDPLDDASQLTVTTGNFGVNLDFGPPYTHFGVNDGAGGGDYGGDTPSDRVSYTGFTGGYLEAYGLASLTNPSVVEWQNINITGAGDLYFSADFASALQPDTADSVVVEAIIDGGTPEQILLFTSATNNGTFQVNGSGTSLTAAAQGFEVPISGTGSSLTIRMTLSLSASTSTGDDIAVDNVVVGQVPLFSIGGSVTGLVAGESVVLQNNNGDDKTVSANGSFSFDTEVPGAYDVSVLTDPTGQTCTVENESGTATEDVTNVVVTCSNDISESLSTLSASALSVFEGDETTLTVTVRDTAGDPVAGLPVTMVVENASVDASLVTIATSPSTTSGTGEAVFTVASAIAQEVEFRASFNPDLFVSVTWASRPAAPVPVMGHFLLLAMMLGLVAVAYRQRKHGAV